MICAKFDWNLPAYSGEDLKKFLVYFYCFAIISPCAGGVAIYLNDFEFAPPKDD
jgi:hypothetical protein